MKSLTDKYKNKEEYSLITELNLSDSEGFQLENLDDLNSESKRLSYLVKLDCSRNYISKMNLKGFPCLEEVIAPENMINEVSINLFKLRKLDLSSNLINKFPNFSGCPNLKELHLAKNLLKTVEFEKLNQVKESLEILDISYNRIEFQNVDSFINFVDQIKLYTITNFSLEGNKFIEKSPIIASSYKTLLFLSMKSLEILNGEEKFSMDELVSDEDIKNQMRLQERTTQVNQSSYYTKFSDHYDVEDKVLSSLTALFLTPRENFMLTSIDDLTDHGDVFQKLEILDLSENYIKKINIGMKDKDFPSLKVLILKKNYLKELTIGRLNNLKELDFSYNQIKEFPNLFRNYKLSTIYANNNLIAFKEQINNLKIPTDNLKVLNLSSNQIYFKNKADPILFDFEKTIKSAKHLNVLVMDNNPCMMNTDQNSKVLEEIRKIIPKKKIVEKKEEEEEKKKPFQENQFENDFKQKDKSEEGKSTSVELYEDRFFKLNDLLEKAISFNGENRVANFEFFKEINNLLDPKDIKVKNKYKMESIFKTFLLNLNELLNLKPSMENHMLNVVARISLVKELNVLKDTLNFFVLYANKREEKYKIIQKAVENVIFDLTNTSNRSEKENADSFETISEIISFFDNLESEKKDIYSKLIFYIIKHLRRINGEEFSLEIRSTEMRNKDKAKKMQKKCKATMDCLNFIKNYLLLNAEKKKDILDCEENYETKRYETEKEKWDEESNSEDLYMDDAGELEIKDTEKVNQLIIKDEKRVLNKLFYNNIANLEINQSNEEEKKISEKNEKNGETNFIGRKDLLESKIIKYEFEIRKGKTCGSELYGSEVLEEIVNDEDLENINILDDDAKEKHKQFIYIFVFVSVFKFCSEFLKEINDFFNFTNTEEKKEEEKTDESNKNKFTPNEMINKKVQNETRIKLGFAVMDLLSTLIDNLDKNIDILLGLNLKNIKGYLDKFVANFMTQDDTTQMERIIIEKIFKISVADDGDQKKRSNLYNNLSVLFIINIPVAFNCLGSAIIYMGSNIVVNDYIGTEYLEIFYHCINSPSANPYILKGICFVMNKILSLLHDEEKGATNIIKMCNKAFNFKNLLNYINKELPQYLSAYREISDCKLDNFDREHRGKKDHHQDPKDFSTLNNPEFFEFMLSILDTFLNISKIGKKFNEFKSVIGSLCQAGMLDIIGSILQIVKDDRLRQKAMECIFNYEQSFLSDRIVKAIIDIVNKYESITEGRTEYIISLIFFTLNKKLNFLIFTGNEDKVPSMKKAIVSACKFLALNSQRETDEEEQKEKNMLTLSLVTFLTTASRSPPLFEDLFDSNSEIRPTIVFNNLLYYDHKYLNPKDYVPINIERTHLGAYLMNLFETFEGFKPLEPYSYTFLRIMIKMADILSASEEFSLDIKYDKKFNEVNFSVDDLFYKYKKRNYDKIKNETLSWFKFKTNCLKRSKNQSLKFLYPEDADINFVYQYKRKQKGKEEAIENPEEKNDDNEEHEEEDEFQVFGKAKNGILDDEYNSKIYKKSNDKATLYFPQYSLEELITQHMYFVINFTNIFYFLFGTKNSKSADPDHAKENDKMNDGKRINEFIMSKCYKKLLHGDEMVNIFKDYQNRGIVNVMLGHIKHFENEIPFSSEINKKLMKKLKNNNYDTLLQNSNLMVNKLNMKKESNLMGCSFESDSYSYQFYGGKFLSLRNSNEETVNNPHLRSLIISSFLRCIYSILISPSIEIRKDFIKILFLEDVYKKFLIYVSVQRFYKHTHLFTILERIFQDVNFFTILGAINYEPYKQSDNKAKEQELQNFIFNDVSSSSTSTTSKGDSKKNVQNNELKIFYNFYLTALIFEKALKFEYMETQKNFTTLFCLEKAIASFAFMYSNINFKLIDQNFRNFYIGRILSSNNHINNIFHMLDQLTYYENHIFNVIKVIRILTDKKVVKLEELYEAGESPRLDKIIKDKVKLLLNILIEIEMDRKLIFYLLPLIVNYDKSNSGKTILNIINLKKNNDSFIRQNKKAAKDNMVLNDNYFPRDIQTVIKTYLIQNKSGKVQEVDEIESTSKLESVKKKSIEYKRGTTGKGGDESTVNVQDQKKTNIPEDNNETQIDNEAELSVFEQNFNLGIKKANFSEKYISSVLENDSYILMNAFVTFTNIIGIVGESSFMNFGAEKSNNGTYLLFVTNLQLLFKRFYKENFELENDKPNFNLTFELSNIKQIIFHDYTARLFIKMKDGKIFTLFFVSTDESNLFVKQITNYYKDIQILQSNNLEKFIYFEMRLKDQGFASTKEEEDNKENEIDLVKKKNIEDAEADFINLKIGNILKHTKVFNFNTTIYQNFYPKKIDKYNINYKYFYFPNKKDPSKSFIIAFGKSILIIKEELENIIGIEQNDETAEYITENEDKQIYIKKQEIPFKSITNIETDFNNLLIRLTSEFFCNEYFTGVNQLELEFEDRFDMYLFSIGLSKINENAYREFMRSEDFKKKGEDTAGGIEGNTAQPGTSA